MKTPPIQPTHRFFASVCKIVTAIFPLVASLWIAAASLSAENLSSPATLMPRIALGIVISALTLAVIALLMRFLERRRMRAAGLTSPRADWRLALWGMSIWCAPAAVTFGFLAFLGEPLTVTGTCAELAQTVLLLLLLAVLLVEALPEEAVFHGYIITVLNSSFHRWWAIILQALLFTLFAGVMRQEWSILELSLFLTMGLAFGYLRIVTGSIWIPIGFHAAFQTGAQLVLAHEALHFPGAPVAAMFALGVVPFTVAIIIVSTIGVPAFVTGKQPPRPS